MKRRFYDDDERPGWGWGLTKGAVAGLIVSVVGVAAISLLVLPPPAPPPAEMSAEAGDPKVVDGIEVSSEPAYFGLAQTDEAPDAATGDGTGAATGEASDIELSGPALTANAAPFDAAPGQPLVAVVFDDTAANPLLHEALFALGMPVTVGIVAGAAGDRVTGRTARDAGYEVVAQLPVAAQGQSEGAMLEYGLPKADAAERTMLLMRRVPMAVAASLPLSLPVPPDGRVLSGILDALGPMGFAYLEHGVAPEAAPTLTSDGIDQIVADSRFSIPVGASAADAHAVLDRASAAAEETGAAVVMAAAEDDVLLALQLWGGEGAEGQAKLAPLSAVVRRQNGGDVLPENATEPEVAAEAGAEPEAAPESEPAALTDTSN